MTATKNLSFEARLNITYNYYTSYQDYFDATCNIVCVDHNIYPSKYWEMHQTGVWRYLHNIADTENLWAGTLIRIAKNGRPRPDFSEEERFLYWFLIHTYRIDGFTDFKELKRRFRTDYKRSKSKG